MSTSVFLLHPRLEADCLVLGDLPVSRLLLMDDRRYPWCILVPRYAGLSELHDVPGDARLGLMGEIEAVSRALLDDHGAAKINVGALGNLVPQLHVHVVGRRPGDDAWPGPVWGSGPPSPYGDIERDLLAASLRRTLGLPPAPQSPGA
jgi:diadenosine tetraphosphate (Ap4A) HIT family hydrolase